MRVRVQVQVDHLERLAAVKRPIVALEELVTNALDANATRVTVDVLRNVMGGIERIRVQDNGHGIDHAEAVSAFQRLGGSWKKAARRSRGEGRMLLGRDGQGRYKAFGLGDTVVWHTRYRDTAGRMWEYDIQGTRGRLTDFDISDPVEGPQDTKPQTVVDVADIHRSLSALDNAAAIAQELGERLALYLREYPSVELSFCGVPISTKGMEAHFAEYDLPPISLSDGSSHAAKLAVIEWSIAIERGLYFCSEDGFAIEKRPPGVQEPGIAFTAYLKSSAIPLLESRAAFAFGEDHPEVAQVQLLAKAALRDHFRARRSSLAGAVITGWKSEHIYPYEGEPQSPLERTSREVFDVVAKTMHDYLPDFDNANAKNRRLSLRLLKEAIENSPNAVQHIMREVLDLPRERAEELSDLLKTTTLASVISAARTVADRLNFLHGLNLLLYHHESKKQLLERAELQQILEEQTWIFGEEFGLTVADQGLEEVLRKHLALLDREPGGDFEDKVTLPDGRKGIVDLMLSRMIRTNRPGEREHLIIELKRPSQKITKKVVGQIEDYALAVAKDARFRDTNTRWHFWAVSNEIDDGAREKVSQKDWPFGLSMNKDNPRIQVWLMPWSRIMEGCLARHQFYQHQLNYIANDETALAHLRRVHDKYLPPVFREKSVTGLSEPPPAARAPKRRVKKKAASPKRRT